MQDTFRVLKTKGKLIFSFLKLETLNHKPLFHNRATHFAKKIPLVDLTTFLHRDWIRQWAKEIGFSEPEFTDGTDSSNHPQFWQSLVVMQKL